MTLTPTFHSDNDTIEKYCYDNDPANCELYGGGYMFREAMDYQTGEGIQGICPDGWHIPTDAEWNQLEIHLGLDPLIANDDGFRGINHGSKLAGSENLWINGALDQNIQFGSSGFDAVPASRSGPSSQNIGEFVYFWSSTFEMPANSNSNIKSRYLRRTNAGVNRDNTGQFNGISVRCLED